MTHDQMMNAVRLALPVTTTAYDMEISDLINAAIEDLRSNGIQARALIDAGNPLFLQAVKTYVRANFRSPHDHDRLMAAYEAQKGHMMQCTGYTVFPSEVTPDAVG